MNKPTIVFTGGGTAGHVTPNLSLIEALTKEAWTIAYIGSKASIEENLIKDTDIPFYSIASGKLRRYFSWKNFIDPFKIGFGILQAYFILRKLKADIVFSKGGFVAFPVTVAAWLQRVPIVAHESDCEPGLANRLSFPFVNTLCLTFASQNALSSTKAVKVTGTPIRETIFNGDPAVGREICGFTEKKPCLLIIGGSLGAGKLNEVIRAALPALTAEYQVVHLCGPNKCDPQYNQENYCQLEYAKDELAHLFALADIIISRSGANSLYEILALQKPHILIPLSRKMSRGEQIQNARYFENLKISVVLDNDTLNEDNLLQAITQVQEQGPLLRQRLQALNVTSATPQIIEVIKQHLK